MKINHLVDDMDGSSEDVFTRYFSLDGKTYEIDLSEENWDELLKIFEPFVKAGRVLKKGATVPKVSRNGGRTNSEAQKIRQWALDQGIDNIGVHGRLPDSVIEAYRQEKDAHLMP